MRRGEVDAPIEQALMHPAHRGAAANLPQALDLAGFWADVAGAHGLGVRQLRVSLAWRPPVGAPLE